ncbi:MAG: creatininase family protein [Caldisphaera sp.]|jgi:creatinine amidohydrolase|nr:MAG: hypothetical protein C0171_04645 [Caldisphaera sp.]
MSKHCARYERLSSEELKDKYIDAIFIIPIGSIEQHCSGPLGLDSILAENISLELCKGIDNSVLLPTIYYGFSPEWINSNGTISLDLMGFISLIKSILTSLYNNGVKKIVIINGHGGNSGILEAILRELVNNFERNTILLLVNYWKILKLNIGHSGNTEEKIAKLFGIDNITNCKGVVELNDSGIKIIVKGPEIPSCSNEVFDKELKLEEVIDSIKNEILNSIEKSKKIDANYFIL